MPQEASSIEASLGGLSLKSGRVNEPELLEELAKLEHEQWVEWSKDLAAKENLSEERLKRWESFWVPYDKLPNDVKEQDRAWARKVLLLVFG